MKLKDINGYKTYIMMGATLLYALGGLAAGFLDWGQAMPLIFGALGLSGLRNGMPNKNTAPQ